MSGWHRVTIAEVIDLQGDHVAVKSVEYLERLREIPHEENRLRIQLENVRDLPETEFLIICAWCHRPVMLRGEGYDKGSRSRKRLHFTHARSNANCPYQNKDIVSQSEINKRKYHGLREGPKHREMKEKFVQSLMRQKNREGDIDAIEIEKIIRSDVSTWRKPDINFRYKDHRIAVEIQLSTTYLDVINDRHAFYQSKDICMLWLFDSLSLKDNDREFAKNDVIFNNNANAYVFDEEAYHRSVENRVVTLKCYYIVYKYNARIGQIDFSWKCAWITFRELTFDHQNNRLFYFDSGKTLAEAKRNEIRNYGFESLMKRRFAFTEHLEEEYQWERQEVIVLIKNLQREVNELRESLRSFWKQYRTKRAAIAELANLKDSIAEKNTSLSLRDLLYMPSKQETESKESLKKSREDLATVESKLEKYLAYANKVRSQKGIEFLGTPELIDITGVFPTEFYMAFPGELYGKSKLGPSPVKYRNLKMLQHDIADQGKTTEIYMSKTGLLAALEQKILDYKMEIERGTERQNFLVENHKELLIQKFRTEMEGIAFAYSNSRAELKYKNHRFRKANEQLAFFDRQLINIRHNLFNWNRPADKD